MLIRDLLKISVVGLFANEMAGWIPRINLNMINNCPVVCCGVLQDRGTQILRKFRSHLKTVSAGRLTVSKFQTVDPQIVDVAVWNLGAHATSGPEFVHPCCAECVILRIRDKTQNLFGSVYTPVHRFIRRPWTEGTGVCCWVNPLGVGRVRRKISKTFHNMLKFDKGEFSRRIFTILNFQNSENLFKFSNSLHGLYSGWLFWKNIGYNSLDRYRKS